MNVPLRFVITSGVLVCAALTLGRPGQPPPLADASWELPPGRTQNTAATSGSTLAPARFPCVLPLVFGNQDIDQDVDSADAQWILAKVAGFRHFPDGGHSCSSEDIDCDGDRDTVDALWLLRYVAGLPYTQHEPCPDIGSEL